MVESREAITPRPSQLNRDLRVSLHPASESLMLPLMHLVFKQLIQLKAFLETEAGKAIYASGFLTLIKLCHLTDSQ